MLPILLPWLTLLGPSVLILFLYIEQPSFTNWFQRTAVSQVRSDLAGYRLTVAPSNDPGSTTWISFLLLGSSLKNPHASLVLPLLILSSILFRAPQALFRKGLHEHLAPPGASLSEIADFALSRSVGGLMLEHGPA